MKESDLHLFWEQFYGSLSPFTTEAGVRIEVVFPGLHNFNSGPDYSNACLRIDGMDWYGNVEIHIRSSDWMRHGHQHDAAYDDILLHVVFDNDLNLDLPCPTLELKSVLNEEEIHELLQARNKSAHQIDFKEDLIPHESSCALDRRLSFIDEQLRHTNNDWDEVWYRLLARSFGFHVNSMPFEWLAFRTPLKVIRQYTNDTLRLEALLFGQAGMLEESELSDSYFAELRSIYRILRIKHNLHPIDPRSWKTSRMRPMNFPHVRLAQFVSVLTRFGGLAQAVLFSDKRENAFFKNVKASEYWNEHFAFGRTAGHQVKLLGSASRQRLMRDAIRPFRRAYAIHRGLQDENVLHEDLGNYLLNEDKFRSKSTLKTLTPFNC